MTIAASQPHDALLNAREVGVWLGLTPSALSQMRFKGTGPRFRKLGPRTVRYAASDVQDWIDRSARVSTVQSAELSVS